MKKKKTIPKPKLSPKMVYAEIANRTNVPPTTIERIMDAYKSIVEESLSNLVEVPLGNIGRFTFNVIPPREHIEWNGFYIDKPVVYYKDKADGYIDIQWKFGQGIQKRIKEATKIPYGSMPAMPGSVERRPRSKTKLNYDDVLKESLIRKYQQQEMEDEDVDDEIDEIEDILDE